MSTNLTIGHEHDLVLFVCPFDIVKLSDVGHKMFLD